MIAFLILTLCLSVSFALDPKFETQIKHLNVETRLSELKGEDAKEIKYGYEIFTKTPKFFGPSGTIGNLTKSRMTCSQCHLEAGTRIFGNSLLDTHGTYPQFRARENQIQTLADRINTCFINPLLADKPIPVESREMRALQLYIKWVGHGRSILGTSGDDRLITLNFLDRAADINKGKTVFENSCVSCHGKDGAGVLNPYKKIYVYPPLWGNESFKTGSSMSRLSILARFVKHNMPYDSDQKGNKLTDEEAWDVSAFILSKPRRPWNGKKPFADIKFKPFDYPIAPYADTFPAEQHQIGPFKPIIEFYNKNLETDNTRPTGI